MLVGGGLLDGSESFPVTNPATAEAFETAPLCRREELDRAVEAAERASFSWSADENARRRVLRACARVLDEEREPLARLVTLEQGKPLGDAREEVDSAAEWFRYAAGLTIPIERVCDDSDTRVEIRHEPLGVVAAIVPWNFPILLAAWKIAPALLAGDTVVLKPSPFTPLSALALGRSLAEIVPAGVLNVVSGGDKLGALMSEHELIRKISFTGSVATGKKVAAAAAAGLKRATLEMGGNDAAVVLDDARPEAIAKGLFRAAFASCGQSCCAIKRLYVHEDRYKAVVESLAEIAVRTRIGDGLKEDTEMGPLNNQPQYERVGELVDDARTGGARFAAGGAPLRGKGYFYDATVVTEVSEGLRLVDEEQFGPVLPIMPYRSVEEAVERANATGFGLSASVWSSDLDRAADVGRALQCGTVWINQHAVVLPQLPFGGWKDSSIGVENGPWGLLGYTQLRTIQVAKKERSRDA